MEIFDGHRALFRPLVTPAVAIGNFDGVHLGHRRLLQATVAAAERLAGDAVVLTFDPHPAQVLAPDKAPPRISSKRRKMELLAVHGISVCVVEPFTRELASLSPESFLQGILVDIFGAQHIVVGYDFTYGHRRAGTTESLRAFGAAHGIGVEIIDPVQADSEVVSSTRIRALVRAGDVATVRTLLGRHVDIDGEVVRGAGRGRQIGIPTANIRPDSDLLLKEGVYAVYVCLLDEPASGDAVDTGLSQRLLGVANLGKNPTFVDQGGLSLEVHLLDFDADLYGRPMRISFVERLRGEKRFDGRDALVRQIQADIARAREVLP